jgi:gas vesicle protein
MNNNSSKVVWFLAGAAVGSTLALLFAPQSGEETRRYLGKKAREGRDRLADMSRDAMDRGRDLYSRGQDLAEDAAELMEDGLDRARRTFQS